MFAVGPWQYAFSLVRLYLMGNWHETGQHASFSGLDMPNPASPGPRRLSRVVPCGHCKGLLPGDPCPEVRPRTPDPRETGPRTHLGVASGPIGVQSRGGRGPMICVRCRVALGFHALLPSIGGQVPDDHDAIDGPDKWGDPLFGSFPPAALVVCGADPPREDGGCSGLSIHVQFRRSRDCVRGGGIRGSVHPHNFSRSSEHGACVQAGLRATGVRRRETLRKYRATNSPSTDGGPTRPGYAEPARASRWMDSLRHELPRWSALIYSRSDRKTLG